MKKDQDEQEKCRVINFPERRKTNKKQKAERTLMQTQSMDKETRQAWKSLPMKHRKMIRAALEIIFERGDENVLAGLKVLIADFFAVSGGEITQTISRWINHEIVMHGYNLDLEDDIHATVDKKFENELYSHLSQHESA